MFYHRPPQDESEDVEVLYADVSQVNRECRTPVKKEVATASAKDQVKVSIFLGIKIDMLLTNVYDLFTIFQWRNT